MKPSLIGASVALTAAVLLAPSTASATTFGCATPAACNGLLYAVTFDGQFGVQQQYSLWILTSASYTGNVTDAIHAVALSEMDGVASTANGSLTIAPSALGSWGFSLEELTANGCAGGGTNSLCAEWTAAGYGVPVLPATTYRWAFRYDKSGASDTQAHIKYEFVRTVAVGSGMGGNAAGAKVGSLGSWDIDVQDNSDDPDQPPSVPDGGTTMTLLGGALVGLGVLRRRFSA